MKKTISQAEARRLRRHAEQLQDQLDRITSTYSSGFPGVNLRTLSVDPVTAANLRTAMRLGYHVVVRHSIGDEFHFYAAPKVQP